MVKYTEIQLLLCPLRILKTKLYKLPSKKSALAKTLQVRFTACKGQTVEYLREDGKPSKKA